MADRIIVVGASLNGITALMEIARGLPRELDAPVLVTQHISAHSPGALPHLLASAGKLPAIHPVDRQKIEKGVIYVAPPDRHMVVVRDRIRLSHGPKENLTRPAIDPLFRSAAMEYGARTVGVILTGQLDDGTAGLLAIKDRGGVTVVQEPSRATAPSMPRSAMKHVQIDHCCALDEIASLLATLAADPPAVDASSVSRLIEIETRIALGTSTLDDWLDLEQLSTPAGCNCPDCRSSLYEIADARMLRFRCRSGHGFSSESLLSGQAEARETLLDTLFGALLDEASIAARIARLPANSPDAVLHRLLADRADRLKGQAEQVGTWLHGTSGLVEPEPEPAPT